jgi:hypothetical protein
MTDNLPACLYCQRNDDRAPLLQVVFKGRQYWICPQHLPILIHKPDQLADQLPGIEIIPGEGNPHD